LADLFCISAFIQWHMCTLGSKGGQFLRVLEKVMFEGNKGGQLIQV